MRATGEEIARAEPGGGKLTNPLRRIAGKRNVMRSTEFKGFLPWLKRSGFIVRCHDCDNCGPGLSQLSFQKFQIDYPVASDFEHPEVASKPTFSGSEHRWMFNGRNPRLPARNFRRVIK